MIDTSCIIIIIIIITIIISAQGMSVFHILLMGSVTRCKGIQLQPSTLKHVLKLNIVMKY